MDKRIKNLVYNYTEEELAEALTRKITQGYLRDDKYDDYKLCYVSSYNPYCYFYKGDIKNVWGDDWGDAPYEHNAEPPYIENYDDFKFVKFDPEKITTIAQKYPYNSPYSVKDLNNKKAPWIFINKDNLELYAGLSLTNFMEIKEDYKIKCYWIEPNQE